MELLSDSIGTWVQIRVCKMDVLSCVGRKTT